MNRPLTQILFWITFAGLVAIFAVAGGGCGGKAPSAPPKPKDTPTLIYGVDQSIRQAKAHNAEAAKTVGRMDQATVEQLKPVALQQIGETDKDLARALEGTKDAAGASAKDQKRITSLLAEVEGYKDWMRTWLRRVGLLLCVAGIGMVLLGWKAGWARHGGAIFLWGAACGAISQYMPTLELGIVLCIGLFVVVVGTYAVWGWLSKRAVLKDADAVTESITTATNDGLLKWEPRAKDVVDAVQQKRPGAKKLVDRVTKRTPTIIDRRGDLHALHLARLKAVPAAK